MIWLVTRFVVVPVKAALGGVKLGFWTGRVVGYRRIVVLGTGVAIGLLFAPGSGAQLRARLKARLDGGVAAPMAAAPRTPTPTVVVPEPVGRPATGASAGAAAGSTVAADAVGAAGAVPDDVMEAAQDAVEATLMSPVPVVEVPVTPEAADEGETIPAVPDADRAIVDPTTA